MQFGLLLHPHHPNFYFYFLGEDFFPNIGHKKKTYAIICANNAGSLEAVRKPAILTFSCLILIVRVRFFAVSAHVSRGVVVAFAPIALQEEKKKNTHTRANGKKKKRTTTTTTKGCCSKLHMW